MKKIVTISDIHLRNIKYHEEYIEIFNQFLTELKALNADYLIILGDLFDSKQISNEAYDIGAWFLKSCADIIPTYIIMGNHDCIVNNKNRMDSISPIVTALKHSNLHYLKESQLVELDEIRLNVLSIHDKENWITELDSSKINIALFHGIVKGAVTETGYTFEEGELPRDLLFKHDYGFLGDIHKRQELDDKWKYSYIGSMIQQNFSEEIFKGYVVFDIEGKDDFRWEFTWMLHSCPFVNIEWPQTKMCNVEPGYHSYRARVISEDPLTLEEEREVRSLLTSAESIKFISRTTGKAELIEMADEDVKDSAYQERLFKDFAKEKKLNESQTQALLDLNNVYNPKTSQLDDVARGITWKVKKLEFDNLFAFGEGNVIDFENIKNCIFGILGKAHSSKSSTIGALVFSIFGETIKNTKKNSQVINHKKLYASSTVELTIDGVSYIVERFIERVKTGDDTKSIVNFSYVKDNEKIDLNGMNKADTERNIRKYFGTLDDFILTTLSRQDKALEFIECGKTDRKKILAKFLDLESFERKHKLAKEDSADLKGQLKLLSNKEYDKEIEKVIIEVERLRSDHQTLANEKKSKEEIRQKLIDSIKAFETRLENKPTTLPDIDRINESITRLNDEIKKVGVTGKIINDKLSLKEEELIKLSDRIRLIDISSLGDQREMHTSKKRLYDALTNSISLILKDLNNNKEKRDILNKVPCEGSFKTCPFLENGFKAQEQIPEIEIKLNGMIKEQEGLKTILDSIDIDQINKDVNAFHSLMLSKSDLQEEIADLVAKRKIVSDKFSPLNSELQSLIFQSECYYRDVKEIEDLKIVVEQLNESLVSRKDLDKVINELDKQINMLSKTLGYNEQSLANLRDQKRQYESIQDQFKIFEVYKEATHSSGLAARIIGQKLPFINSTIERILKNIEEFKLYFDEDYDLYIRYPNQEATIIEGCSGSEQNLSAFAVRIALSLVSSLPMSQVLILDEVGGSFDETQMLNFIDALGMLKLYYESVVIISHLDQLKMAVDRSIEIESVNGFANIRI